MRFTEKNNAICLCLEGKNEHGDDQFAYVAILEKDLSRFRRLYKTQHFLPHKLGKVIFAAKGKLTAEIKRFIELKYIKAEGVEILETKTS